MPAHPDLYPSPTAPVPLRPHGGPRVNDCSDPAVRERITGEITALPFLGTLTCSTRTLTAGATEELVLTYTVGSSGIADSGWLKLCFRYYSDWDLQVVDPAGRDYATARLIHRSLVGGASPDSAATAQRLDVRYDVKGGERPFQKSVLVHVVDGYLRPGDVIEIRLGDRRFGGPGTRVQTFVEDAFAFHLFVDPLGTSRMAHAGACHLAIVPGPPERLVVHGPRLVRADAGAVDLHAHLQDRWGNACRDLPVRLRATRADRTVATATTPATGWARATLTVPPVGDTDEILVAAEFEGGAVASARCHLDTIADLPAPRAFFADLHVHSDDTVGTQDTAWNLAYGREIGALDVLGYTANDFQITDETWDEVVAACRRAGEDGRFVCYPGVEWCGTAGVGGDHNVVFLGEDTTLARSLSWHANMSSTTPVPETWPITELYAAYDRDPDSYLLIPHVGGRRAVLDWHHPELERLIEVHSTWASSPWFLEDALARGLRLGASAASDEHRGRPGSGAPGANIFGAAGGLTGVLAPELTAAEVGRTLRARRTWATTGARAVALLRSGDRWMGDDIVPAATELDAEYAVYGTTGWEEMRLFDAAGEVWRRDLHAETGLSDTLVRVRWGGARHRDRYRWASWTGRMRITGTDVTAAEPWAALHPEQQIAATGNEIAWRTTTYGADIGVVLTLGALADARFELETTVREDDRRGTLEVTGAELIRSGHRELAMGGLDLRLRIERIADPAGLPVSVRGAVNLAVPPCDSAVYLRARQFDGHQAWTSPLFLTRTENH
ncbi:hypothetical protein ACFXPS_16090 [Nocardia sp. NPDC059091]|uniref:hypothetical protein n=1 Tax=unclassified Nocardia TaxID=2637762 RepID=UPI00367450F7